MQSGNRAICARAVGAAGASVLTWRWRSRSARRRRKTRPYVMKVTLPTINDAPHQVRQRFCRAGREGFRRAHQGRGLSGEPIGLDPAADRRHAVRRHPGRGRSAGIFRRRRRALRSDGDAGPGRFHRAWPARRRRSGGAQADVRARRAKGAARRRTVHRAAVLRHLENPDPASRRLQGQEDPNLRVAVPDRWRSIGSAQRRWR